MPTLTQEDVCTFDQLSDSAKETARDWMRDCEIEDFGQDTESLYYSALAAAKILGIDFDDKGKRSEPDIRWSGFSSQGGWSVLCRLLLARSKLPGEDTI